MLLARTSLNFSTKFLTNSRRPERDRGHGLWADMPWAYTWAKFYLQKIS
jgi:hypothetical protein